MASQQNSVCHPEGTPPIWLPSIPPHSLISQQSFTPSPPPNPLSDLQPPPTSLFSQLTQDLLSNSQNTALGYKPYETSDSICLCIYACIRIDNMCCNYFTVLGRAPISNSSAHPHCEVGRTVLAGGLNTDLWGKREPLHPHRSGQQHCQVGTDSTSLEEPLKEVGAWSEEEGKGCHKTDLLLSCSQGLTPEIMTGWKSQGTHLAMIRKKLCWSHLQRQWAASGGSESPIAGGSQGKTEAPVEHGCRGNDTRGRKAELQKC